MLLNFLIESVKNGRNELRSVVVNGLRESAHRTVTRPSKVSFNETQNYPLLLPICRFIVIPNSLKSHGLFVPRNKMIQSIIWILSVSR